MSICVILPIAIGINSCNKQRNSLQNITLTKFKMARISLKNILSKKNDTAVILNTFIEKLNAGVWIEDEAGNTLLGIKQNTVTIEYPIQLADELLGFVKGDEHGKIISDLLIYLIKKESEKKNLGAEVLNLYKEINLVFNFSEKLANTIDATSVSKIALEEAGKVIQSNSGVVVLWDELNKQLEVVASSGESFFEQGKMKKYLPLLTTIILGGQSEILSDLSSLTEAGLILPGVKSILYSALKVKHRVMGAVILASHDSVSYTASDLKLLTTLALQSSSAIESALLYEKNICEAKEREEAMRKVYEVTGKFVPYEFIGSLGHQFITDVKLGDQVEKIVTVLFSDIRSYTTLSEQLTPEENFKFIFSFNERIGPIIRKHHGFINQYLGDAIMAIFPGNASDALLAAIDMQKEVEELNKIREAANQTPIQIGVGMHTGPLIMGITGDKDRMDATTISDAVNTASRIEGLTKYYKAGILISDATLSQIQDQENFHLRYLGKVQLKGKQISINIHECFDSNTKEQVKNKMVTLSNFNLGIEYFLNRYFDKAGEAFQTVVETDPDDQTAKFFHNKAIKYYTEAPVNWMGVEEMSTK